MNKRDSLFYQDEIENFLKQIESNLFNEIESQDEKYILEVDINEFKRYLIKKYTLIGLSLDESKIYIDDSEEEIDVSQDERRIIFNRDYIKGLKIDYHIPFKGYQELFRYKPSTFSFNPPHANIQDNEVIIEIIELSYNKDSIKREFEQKFNNLKQWLNWINQDINQFNLSLDNKIEQKIKTRKEELIKNKSLVSDLGFPLKKREDSVNTYTVPEIRRKIDLVKPTVTTSAAKPEPTLSIVEYDNILKIISNMALVMERSPKAFSKMDEESIRQHFLVQLNGHYEGQATGETFNYEGKTDILIRVNGKNIFIAECKFWQGKEKLIETIDQILKYLSWRDTKTSIILFNRNKDLSNVLKQIPEIVKNHNNFKKELNHNSETEFRFIMNHKDDKERELYLTIPVFEVPQ